MHEKMTAPVLEGSTCCQTLRWRRVVIEGSGITLLIETKTNLIKIDDSNLPEKETRNCRVYDRLNDDYSAGFLYMVY